MRGYAEVPKQCIKEALDNYYEEKSKIEKAIKDFESMVICKEAKLTWRWSKFKWSMETKEETKKRVFPHGVYRRMKEDLPHLYKRSLRVYVDTWPVAWRRPGHPGRGPNKEAEDLKRLLLASSGPCLLSPDLCNFINKFHRCEF